MATVTFDGPNKLLKGIQGVTEHDVQIDWYSDWKEWMHLSDNAKFSEAMRSIGGDDISEVQTAGDTYFLTNGWKFEPYAEDANIVIVGNVYVDDTVTYGDNRWIIPAGAWQIGVEFNVSNLVDSAIAQSSEIQHASFDGMVHIDQTSSNSGTVYPVGNTEFPVNNISDAVIIAISRGFTIFHIDGNFTVGATDDISEYDIRAGNPLTSVTTLIPGCTTANTIFQRTTLQGTASGKMIVSEAFILNLNGFEGTINRCGFLGTITLAGGNTTHIVQCYDGFEGFGEPIIDFGGSGQGLNMRDWQGGIRFENKSGTEDVSVGLNGGRLEIAADVTAGEIVVRGVGEISENLGTATIKEDGLVNKTVITNAVWDELLTGNTHNIQNSAGKRLRDIASQAIHTDTAQGPAANGNQIKLAVAASTVDGAYDPSMITIIDGTGAGQTRLIYQYEGSTRVATVDRNWKVNPDATSEYIIFSHPGREHVNEGLARGGTSNTITLNTLASSIDDVYNYQTIFIRSGVGEDQTGLVIAYNGTTKVATIEGLWDVIPDTTTGYVMLPNYYNPVAANAASFHDEVHIDVANGSAGTIYPIGTSLNPVNNLADAKIIGGVNGITNLKIIGTLVIGASDDINGFTMLGENVLTSVIVLTAGCTTAKTTFMDMIVTGPVNGSVFMEKVGIQMISNIGSNTFPTVFFKCIFRAGANSFRAGLTTPQNIHFIECVSGVPGVDRAMIDINNTDSPISFRKFGGGIEILNYTGGQMSSFEFDQGHMTVDVSCNNGSIQLGGIYKLTDNGTLTITERNKSIGTATWTHDIGAFEDSTSNQMAGTLVNEMHLSLIQKLFIDQDKLTPIGSRVTQLQIFRRDQSLYFNWIVTDKDGNPVVPQGTGPVDRGEPNFNPSP